ncbi:aspartate kinase [Sneathiella glossodoripedis]|uniref:aspartate kinase n=1 Tax=Sneathiella glossodoripedis TaxID=418853 RepID=UPI00046FDB6C|nr:aspartate kinase [Sneathiella glossodoripedis]
MSLKPQNQDNKKQHPTHTVHKIGGTSMDAVETVFENILVGDREGDALYNRIFVVSAYSGMTDLLLEHKKTTDPGVFSLYANSDNEWAWGDALSRVSGAMHEKNRECLKDNADLDLANRFVEERIEGVRSCLIDLHRLCSFGHFQLPEHLATVREMLSSLGEAHSAFNTMLLLKRRGVNAVFVDLSGWRENSSLTLDQRIEQAFSGIDLTEQLPIVTGYAQCEEGLTGIYGRGYSEVTFSRIACLTGSKEAIIHKEFHLSSADPKIVPEENIKPIGKTNYDVADQLANMGMEAIHPKAAKGLRQQNIPLRIMNCFEPNHDGTIISDDGKSRMPRVEIITGLPSVYEIEIFNQDMVGTPGASKPVHEAFARYKLWTLARYINANTMTHYVSAPLKQIKRCINEIQENLPSAEIRSRKVAVVSAIGSNLENGQFFEKAIAALANADIRILATQKPSRNVDLQFVIAEKNYETAIRALHKELVEANEKGKSKPVQKAA